jgi:xanthine/uracil permease
MPPSPSGALGGITVVLYGMIGLLGAKIWIENRVNFANPVNFVPIAAGIIIAIGAYHFARAIAPLHIRDDDVGAERSDEQ